MSSEARDHGEVIGLRFGKPLLDRIEALRRLIRGRSAVDVSRNEVIRQAVAAGVESLLLVCQGAEAPHPATLRADELGRRVARLEEVLRAWQGVGTDVERGAAALSRAREDTQRVLDEGRR